MSRMHTLHLPGAVPGVVIRLLLAIIATVGVLALNPYPLWQGIGIVAALASVVIPRALLAWVAAACIPFGMLLSEPSAGRTALAVLCVHAIHVLAGLSLTIPLTSRVRFSALLPSVRRFVTVQLIAQPIAWGVQLLVPVETGPGIGWTAPVAAVMLLAGVVLALRAARNVGGPS